MYIDLYLHEIRNKCRVRHKVGQRSTVKFVKVKCDICHESSDWNEEFTLYICPHCGNLAHVSNPDSRNTESASQNLDDIDRLYPFPKIADYAPNWTDYAADCAKVQAKRHAYQEAEKSAFTKFGEAMAITALVVMVTALKNVWKIESIFHRGATPYAGKASMPGSNVLLAGIDNDQTHHSQY